MVICKEIFHIVFDGPNVRNMDIAGHVQDVVAVIPEEEVADSVIIEFAAYAAAMEFLFPHAERVKHSVAKTPFVQLAQMYALPIDMVDIYMSEKMLEILTPE